MEITLQQFIKEVYNDRKKVRKTGQESPIYLNVRRRISSNLKDTAEVANILFNTPAVQAAIPCTAAAMIHNDYSSKILRDWDDICTIFIKKEYEKNKELTDYIKLLIKTKNDYLKPLSTLMNTPLKEMYQKLTLISNDPYPSDVENRTKRHYALKQIFCQLLYIFAKYNVNPTDVAYHDMNNIVLCDDNGFLYNLSNKPTSDNTINDQQRMLEVSDTSLVPPRPKPVEIDNTDLGYTTPYYITIYNKNHVPNMRKVNGKLVLYKMPIIGSDSKNINVNQIANVIYGSYKKADKVLGTNHASDEFIKKVALQMANKIKHRIKFHFAKNTPNLPKLGEPIADFFGNTFKINTNHITLSTDKNLQDIFKNMNENYQQQQRVIVKMVKCLNERKMKSASRYLQEAIKYNIKEKIIKALKDNK